MNGASPKALHASTGQDWTQQVGSFASVPALIRQWGIEPAAILKEAGLGPEALAAPDARVSCAALGKVLYEAARRTDCSHFGLLVGRMWRMSDLGLVGELVHNSATVGEALRTLTKYQYLNDDGAVAFLVDRGRMVDFGYAIYQPCYEGPDIMYDALAAIAKNLVCALCGPGWRASEVLLPHARPRDPMHYRNLLKASVRFDSEICALRFPAECLAQRIQGANAELLQLAKQKADSAPRPELLQQVYRAIRTLLLHERHSGDDVAAMLDMNRRTLNRRLQAQGFTFQQALDTVRFTTACDLLAVSDIPLDNVAATLGYAGVSPFMRTFNRWAGTTPARWRKTMRSSYASNPPNFVVRPS
jgi:AraC-like DNA-binding protein